MLENAVVTGCDGGYCMGNEASGPWSGTGTKMIYICSFFEKKDRKIQYSVYPMKCTILPVDALQGQGSYSATHGYTHAPSLFMTHTPRTLATFDGEGTLLAIAGTTFDVTAGRGFYGPGERT